MDVFRHGAARYEPLAEPVRLVYVLLYLPDLHAADGSVGWER